MLNRICPFLLKPQQHLKHEMAGQESLSKSGDSRKLKSLHVVPQDVQQRWHPLIYSLSV
jgi:hypothetical protein